VETVKMATTSYGAASKPLDMITVRAKDGVHATANDSRGFPIHFDSHPKADPLARNPVVPLRDYTRLLRDGYIERNDDAEALLTAGEEHFVPAGMMMVGEEQLEQMVSSIVERRLAAMQPAENSVGPTTGLSTKALTAYPDNQPVGHIDPDADFGRLADEAPTAGAEVKRGRGRPPKAAPVAPAVAIVTGGAEQGEGGEPIDGLNTGDEELPPVDPDAPPVS
jgi:hypothetical protein